MADITRLIKKFIEEEIKLFQKDISDSARSRNWFLKKLKTEIESRSNQPALYGPAPFIHFGSYFKKTKVSTVDEFDVLVVIDSNSGFYTRDGIRIGEGIGEANPNPKYYSKYKKSDGSGVSPSKILNWLKEVVETVTDRYNGETPIRDGQAITARIKSRDLKIDLVPAGIFDTAEGERFYNISAANKENSWILTNPKDDISLLSEVAEGKDDFRKLIRLLKFIRSKYRFSISSFAIESAVVQYGKKYRWNNDLYNDLIGILTFLSQKLRDGVIEDPFDKTTNMLEGVESSDWYAERIDKIITGLQILKVETNEEKANLKLFKLFRNE